MYSAGGAAGSRLMMVSCSISPILPASTAVQWRGGADDDGVDLGVGEDLLGVLAGPGPVGGGELLGRVLEGVADQGELGLGVGGDGLGVDVADAAGADDGDGEHPCSFCV